MINSRILLAGIGVFSAAAAYAQTEVTIYNQDLALVKKSETAVLKKGANDIAFEEVSRLMKPESVFVYGQGINVLEQNYDYAGIDYLSMLNAYVGQKVKTVRVNPADGSNIYETATLLAVNGGMPVLAFNYGVEMNFPGRVLFDKVPDGLHSEPVLRAKVEAQNSGEQQLNLAYLTTGLSWQANYVATVNDAETLTLLGRAMLNNNSGGSFDEVKVSLIAGDVNVVQTALQPRFYAKSMVVNAMAESSMDMAAGAPVMEAPNNLNGYYIYQIPQATTLKDGQMKQVSFLNAPKVNYEKVGVINSTLSFGNNKTFYKNKHPEVVYTFYNNADDGLGMPLPQGKISFYDYDKTGALQFVGENSITNKARGEEVKLTLGRFFDVFASGSVDELSKQVKKRYKKTATDRCDTTDVVYTYDIRYEVANKSDDEVKVVLKQNLPSTTVKIVEESVKGKSGEGSVYEWQMVLKPDTAQEVKVKAVREVTEPDCGK